MPPRPDRAPVLLAWVVMGKRTLSEIEKIRHLSSDIDAYYDECEARARADRADVAALMVNDTARSMLRYRRRAFRR